MTPKTIDGVLYSKMIRMGAANLGIHAEEINNLNVFPIPDGDTGDNMLMTMTGGKNAIKTEIKSLSDASNTISSGMLLSARGNSGVILSQFFDGISAGFTLIQEANLEQIGAAFREGVKHAYEAVMKPVEGTILTVAKDATEYACSTKAENVLQFIENFIYEAKLSLNRTPSLLPVLKKAGVVDSGGAGLIYIFEGMRQCLKEDSFEEALAKMESESGKQNQGKTIASPHGEIDLDAFGPDSELEFGYCTEVLLRLQNKKCNVEEFSADIIKDYMNEIGNSVVCFKAGSIIKLHVHTMEPWKVFKFCQQYGEFLTTKAENMSLQHNNRNEDLAEIAANFKMSVPSNEEAKDFGIVAVASGPGIKQMFLEHGTDVVVDGGQSMNPSAEDFIKAFGKINAKTIFVFPNNGNVILAAQQAAKMYEKADIQVIGSKSIGEGFAALTMMDLSSGNIDEIKENFQMGMDGVSSYYVSHCVRDAEMDGLKLHAGDYIGFQDKKIMVSSEDRKKTAFQTVEAMDFTDHEVCIFIRGIDSTTYESEEVKKYLQLKHPGVEINEVDGGQDIYSYILIVI